MAVRFSELINTDRIIIPIQDRSKNEVIEDLIGLLANTGAVSDKEQVLEGALNRESQGSTAIGKNVAIPHTKCAGVNELSVSLGLASPGIDWEADDGEPCEIIFFMAAPPGASGPHIQALSALAKLINLTDLRERLRNAQTAKEAYAAIAEEEASIMPGTEDVVC